MMGMDVGGTLTKIVYLKRFHVPPPPTMARAVTDGGAIVTSGGRSGGPGGVAVDGSDDMNEAMSHPQMVRMHSDGSGTSTGDSLKFRTNSHGSLAQLDDPEHQEALSKLYNFIESTKSGKELKHDDGLDLNSEALGGKLHFCHFETKKMVSVIKQLAANNMVENFRTIGCTGGGAHKYAQSVEESLDIKIQSHDELSSLVKGMHYTLTNVKGECYTYRSEVEKGSEKGNSSGEAVSAPSSPASERRTAAAAAAASSSSSSSSAAATTAAASSSSSTLPPEVGKQNWRKDLKTLTRKVSIQFNPRENIFPYLVVNIGSGVSILKVNNLGDFERVSGSSVGGGTYWGLCRLLVPSKTSYQEVIDLAEEGDAEPVDMLVGDIYGGGYDGIKLKPEMTASSFGKLVMKENPREGVKEGDMAIALLMMITNNIGQVAFLNAQLHKCSKIFFVGTFLRENEIARRKLAFAIDFWSKGAMEAQFLLHEGYFGALGTLLVSAVGKDKVDDVTQNGDKANNDGNGDDKTKAGDDESSSSSSSKSNGSSSSSNNNSSKKIARDNWPHFSWKSQTEQNQQQQPRQNQQQQQQQQHQPRQEEEERVSGLGRNRSRFAPRDKSLASKSEDDLISSSAIVLGSGPEGAGVGQYAVEGGESDSWMLGEDAEGGGGLGPPLERSTGGGSNSLFAPNSSSSSNKSNSSSSSSSSSSNSSSSSSSSGGGGGSSSRGSSSSSGGGSVPSIATVSSSSADSHFALNGNYRQIDEHEQDQNDASTSSASSSSTFSSSSSPPSSSNPARFRSVSVDDVGKGGGKGR